MLRKIFTVPFIFLLIGGISYAENWHLVADPDANLEELVNTYYKKLPIPEKKDVIKAFKNINYNVFVDKDSIKEIGEGKIQVSQKAVFDEEYTLEDSEKKIKYIIAKMTYDCNQKIIWFVDGASYDINGQIVRNSQTVFVPVELEKIPDTAFERVMWSYICTNKESK